MKLLSQLGLVILLLLTLGAAKVLLRTNPVLAISIIAVCAVFFWLYWLLHRNHDDEG